MIVVKVPFVRKEREFPAKLPLIGDVKITLAFN